jgi:ligand-binding sensor domain-containing protein
MGQENHGRIPGILLCGILMLSCPVMAGLVLFSAGPDQMSSVGVLDIAQDPRGNLFFGTDNGLSFYDGSWHITHRTYGDTEEGLLSDHILSLEFDHEGNLWIGYPNGLQRLENGHFITLRDQQLLKSLDIHGLLRRGGEMWVAAGNAGLHRYLDGEWRWFPPGGKGSPGCSYVTSMATDPAADTLYVACREGIWSTEGTGASVVFSQFTNPGLIQDPVRGIRGDPFGGIYVFNSSVILHFVPPGRWEVVVTSGELLPTIEINDLGAGSDGTLWIATNHGIYAWKNWQVRENLDAAAGIRNNAVKRILIDGSHRLWFVTPDNVGFLRIDENPGETSPSIPITTFEVPMSPAPASTPEPQVTPGISVQVSPERHAGTPDPLGGLLESLREFFAKVLPG